MHLIVIRRARPDDADVLSRLAEQTFRETFLEDFAIPYPADDLAIFVPAAYGLPVTQEILADPEQAVWLAEVNGHVAGYCQVAPCGLPHPEARREHGEVKRLYVMRDRQGLGVGRQLFHMASDWLSVRGGPAWLGVWSGNLKAQRFYARAGFVRAGFYEFAVGRWRDQEFIMRRD